MSDRLVDLTEPICQRIDKAKASMLLFDTSGIEAWVTENNPKYANRIIRQLKIFKKANGLDAYPDIVVGKKSDSPDEDKSLADSKALIPVRNLPAAGWFIFILRKICVPTPVQSVVKMNGTPPAKSE